MKPDEGEACKVGAPADFLKRGVNEGFSGGEKKRNEIFQMAAAGAEARDPRRDRLGPGHRRPAVVADGVNALRARALDDRGHPLPASARLHRAGHVLARGRIVRSGDRDLARELEETGYAGLEEAATAAAGS
jgi:Fe-S cluster assembly ATP-binding protein